MSCPYYYYATELVCIEGHAACLFDDNDDNIMRVVSFLFPAVAVQFAFFF